MENPKEVGGKNGDGRSVVEAKNWASVPAFGDWDMKAGMPDYSLDFSKIRAARKQRKKVLSWASAGSGDEAADDRIEPPASRCLPPHHQRADSGDLCHPLHPVQPPKVS